MSTRFHRGLGYTSFVIDAGLPEECSRAGRSRFRPPCIGPES